MKKILISILALAGILSFAPKAFADGGVYASGGGSKTAGQTFTVSVVASGATFDSLQGVISISGPVDVVSFSAGNATWLPGKTPSNGGQFVGITSATSSLTIATIKLRGKTAGTGAVSVSGAKLASQGSVVGTGAGSASFTIQRALQLPAAPTVSSTTHPDQNTAYEATAVTLSWNQDKGVTGFSYLIDQATATVPASKATDSNTSVSYNNEAVGTYYFHIKAQNGDGWSDTTHFKITIKEPDAKINDQLAKPSGITIAKDKDYTVDIVAGTLTGIRISGKTEPGYTASIIFDPAVTLPAGKSLSAKADATGHFDLLLDFPVKAGFYKLTVQGQSDKVLTPISDPISFEAALAKGGSVNILTTADLKEPVVAPAVQKKWYEKIGLSRNIAFYIFIALILIFVIAAAVILVIKRRSIKKLAKSIKVN